jgi:DmsE family decaheme c-type cytochrome
MRHLLDPLRTFVPGLLAALLCAGLASAADDLVLKGDAKCTRCHDDEKTDYPILPIGKTRHGTIADKRTPTCASCHGESEAHTRKLPDSETRVKPDIWFTTKTTTAAVDQNRTCLTCHQGGKRIHWQSSAHATRDVPCTACHQVHVSHDPVRVKARQSETCYACHKEQRVQASQPFHHPINEGKVTCSDCHNPHGSAGPAMVARDSINATCYTCHSEKRGPFVRNHQPVQENCALCHSPHGTTHASLLKMPSPFLCQQCHEPLTHEGTIPGNVGGAGTGVNRAILLARGCSNCHTSVHGTNNPANTTGVRSFRR